VLAAAYWAQGRNADAEPLFLRALAMFDRVSGSDSPDVGRTLNNLGVVSYSLNRYDDAERYYQRAEASLQRR
jgi:tetratricopeptide (TPR) repeat protein